MKLIKCHVSSFGALKDFDFSFSDGLNTVKQENGWGKSTLACFLKSMFYGLYECHKKIDDNERMHYKPWGSNDLFGGYVIFEWAGKQFKIERFFGNKSSEDTVQIFDVETGKPHKNTEDLGKRIFGIDQEGFLSTTFLSQKDFEIKSNSSITAKFNEVCEVQDSKNFDDAVKILEEKTKEYKRTGDKGLIADTQREIFAINGKIEQSNNAQKNVLSLRAEVEELNVEVSKLSAQSEQLRAQVEKIGKAETVAEKKKNYQKILSQKEGLLAQKQKYDVILNGKKPSEETLDDAKSCINNLNNAKIQINILKADVNSIEQQTLAQAEDKKINRKILPTALILGLLSIFCICLGIVLKRVWLPVLIAIGVIGLVCAVLIIVKNANSTKKEEPKQSVFLQNKKEELGNYENFVRQYSAELKKFFDGFNIVEPYTESVDDNFEKLYETIKTACSQSNFYHAEIEKVESEIRGLSGDKDVFSQEAVTESFDSVNNKLKTVMEWYKEKTDLVARKKASITLYENEADSLPDLENAKNELGALIKEYKQNYELVKKTKEFLEEADQNLKIKYKKPLGDSLNKYLNYVSGDKYIAEIDVDFKVKIVSSNGEKDVDYFSKGTKNLFEICKRFALTDVLFTGEKPFIILDDPFYNLDDEKTIAALDLIKNLQKEYQIIYLVCHNSRMV